MVSQAKRRMGELLVATKAFRDLDTPVILTSGELGIYYINSENLLEDNGKWTSYATPSAMIAHAIRISETNGNFREVIDLLSKRVGQICLQEGKPTISGGERRDWLFSGPVAHRLDLPHIALFKNDSTPEVSLSRRNAEMYLEDLSDYHDIHVADLLTEGSSCYTKSGDQEKGWIPALRKRGARVEDLVAIVTRLQGGEENLASQGVDVQSFVGINEEFLRTHSKLPDRAVAYQRNPHLFSVAYLTEHGAMSFVEAFKPEAVSKDQRAFKFVDRYKGDLVEAGKWNEFATAVREKYDLNLDARAA